MRWVSLFIICAATSLLNNGVACAAADGAFRISDWVGRAYWNQQNKKQLDHCSAQLTNANKITIIYSLDHQYMWRLELSSPAWKFTKGASFPVAFGFGNRGYSRLRAVATEAQLVRVKLPDSLSAFEALRSIIQLKLVAGGLTTHFDLTNNNQVLTALTQCVSRYGATSRSRADSAAWLKLLSSHGPDNNLSIPKEASALAANVMTEAAIPKAASLKPSEVPAGLTGDAFWSADKTLFTVTILPRNEAPDIANIPGLIIGGDAQKCRGDFFSGSMFDTINKLRVARAFTNCQSPQSTTSIYYLAVPRKQGGLYLLTTFTNGFEIAAPGQPTARDIDRKIRDSIRIALSKLQ
jgi:hypothetical protein